MTPFARRLLLHGALALLLLALMGIAWPVLAPAYNRAASSIGDVLAPAAVRVSSKGSRLLLTYRSPLRPRSYEAEIDGLTLQGGLLLLTALALATPKMQPQKRLLWAGGTVVAFLVLHGVMLAFFAWAYRWEFEGGGITLTGVQPAVPLLHVALPALLGAGWVYMRWLER